MDSINNIMINNFVGNIFYNTNLPDNKVKIEDIKFRKQHDKYSLVYSDKDLCGRSGTILINFTDSSKTQLQ